MPASQGAGCHGCRTRNWWRCGRGCRCRRRDLFIKDPELLGGHGDFFRGAVERFEAGVEGLDVIVENLGGVALGVQGDEHHLHDLAIAAHQFLGLGGAGQGGRADGRALGEAEEHHRHQAAVRAQGDCFAVSILELESAAHDLVTEVLAVLEVQLGAVVTAAQQAAQAQQAHAGQHFAAGE